METTQPVTENNPFEDVTIINVISGKGGTGKTCFTNVLVEELGKSHKHQVLVIDLDFPVRGTTFFTKLTNDGSLRNVQDGKSVTSFFHEYHETVVIPVRKAQAQNERPDRIEELKKTCLINLAKVKVDISQFASYYLIPSTDWIAGGYLSYDPYFQWSDTDVREALEALIRSALASSPFKKKTFDYVFLDNRAGYDLFVAEAHKRSDFSILVQEDDNVSNITADELYEQLRALEIREKGTVDHQILRVRNKVLPNKLLKEPSNPIYTSDIPFDTDVMRIFGERRFWSKIKGTLYYRAVIKAWNCIDAKMNLNAFLRDIEPLDVVFRLSSKLSILPKLGRLLFLYGFAATLSAFVLLFTLVYGAITPEMMSAKLDFPVITVLGFLTISGMLAMIISVFFIGGKRERPKGDSKRDYQDDA